MAYTCDKCGKSDLPDSHAFLQHLSICPAFRKAQEELEASRAKRAEVYVRELAEQKERVDTAKKPVLQQVERRKEIGGTAGDQFQCRHCFGNFSKKANLIHHLLTAVSCKRKVSADEIKDIRENAPKDPSSECPHCGAVVTKSVMSRHINLNCPARKSAKQPTKAPRVDMNVSRDSLVDRAENLDIIETPVEKLKEREKTEGDAQRERLAESDCRQTAEKSYRKKKAEMEEHSKFQNELNTWTPAEDAGAAVELDEGNLEVDRARVNRVEKEKAVQKKTAQNESVQANKSARKGGRYFFSPDDRKIVQRAFLFALDSDGNRKTTITSYIGTMKGQKSDFYKAYDGDKVFKGMIDRIMEEEEFEWAEMKTKIMNCYRALYRENPGNTSASSGAGKAKSLKPKTSKKDATKSPAKKKQRWAEESDSEDGDSADFSEESSEWE